MANNPMKQAASGALSYFAVVANTEQSVARREFSRKAGNWIADAVEKIGGNKIVTDNTDATVRKNVLESQYELANKALQDQTLLAEIDYRGGWNKLKETLKGQMDETSRLAGDLDSVYSKQNDLLLELAENELIGPARGEVEEIDKKYVGLALSYIGTANAKVAQPAQIVWGNEISGHGPVYDRMEPDFTKAAGAHVKKLNDVLMKNAAIYSAITDMLVAGKKVTKEEFMNKLNEHESDMSAKISSAIKQMEESLKNPQVAAAMPEYKGQEFA